VSYGQARTVCRARVIPNASTCRARALAPGRSTSDVTLPGFQALSDNRTGGRLRVIVAAGEAREHGVVALRHASATQPAAASAANGAKDGYQTGPGSIRFGCDGLGRCAEKRQHERPPVCTARTAFGRGRPSPPRIRIPIAGSRRLRIVGYVSSVCSRVARGARERCVLIQHTDFSAFIVRGQLVCRATGFR
jgi:hypothetical protein